MTEILRDESGAHSNSLRNCRELLRLVRGSAASEIVNDLLHYLESDREQALSGRILSERRDSRSSLAS